MDKKSISQQISSIFSGGESQNLVIVLVLLVVFAVWYFSFLPLKSTIAGNYIQIENLKRDQIVLEEKRTRLMGLEKNIQERANFISQVLDVLPETQQIPEILYTMEQLAAKNNLVIADFSPRNKEEERVVIPGENAPRVTANPWKTVQLDFNITGSYADLKQFLQDLELNIRPVDVQSVVINGGGEFSSGAPLPLRFSVTAFTYYKEVAQ